MNETSLDTSVNATGMTDDAGAAQPHRHEWPFPGWSRRFFMGALLWVALTIAAMFLADVPVAAWMGKNVPIHRLMWLFEIIKFPGNFIFTLVIAAMLAIWHRGHWRAAGFLCLCGIVSGILGALIKWVVGRTRPLHDISAFELHPFQGGLMGLLDAHNLSFPSGHTCLAFATAAALMILIPRWRVVFFAIALVVASERILQDSHYVADVVAAGGIGILSAFLTWWFCDRVFGTGRSGEEPSKASPIGTETESGKG